MALLRGPTGIRVGGGTAWVRAFYRGVPIAGLSYVNAGWFEDGGKRQLYAMVGYYWGKTVAEEVIRGGVVFDD